MLAADLHDLIAYIVGPLAPPVGGTPVCWQTWQISPIDGGRNGRVFRATCARATLTGERADLAVKLTARDRFDRAGREYQALQMIGEAGLTIAPRPLLLDRDGHPTQVVVMTWLDGTVSDDLPASDEEWRLLVEHLVSIHAITPATTGRTMPDAVLTMRNPAEGVARIRHEIDQIPRTDQQPALRRLLDRFEGYAFPTWPDPPVALRRGDPNIRNIVRRPGPWASVDWEYSGWCDPAFEIADLIAHAAYLDVPTERWAWVSRLYTSLVADDGAASRLAVYVPLMYGFWVGRLGRMLYQIPRGLDERPAPWPPGWLESVEPRYEQYLELANQALG